MDMRNACEVRAFSSLSSHARVATYAARERSRSEERGRRGRHADTVAFVAVQAGEDELARHHDRLRLASRLDKFLATILVGEPRKEDVW